MRLKQAIGILLATAAVLSAASVDEVLASARRMCLNDSVPQALVMLDTELTDGNWRERDEYFIHLEKGDILLYYPRLPREAYMVYEGLSKIDMPADNIGALYYHMGFSLEQSEDFVGAARAYEKVVTEYPDSPFYDDALAAIERCFTKNYELKVAEVDGYPISELAYNEVFDRLRPAERDEASGTEGRTALIERIIFERLLKIEAASYYAPVDSTEVLVTLNCLGCRPKRVMVPGHLSNLEVERSLRDMQRELLLRPLYNQEVLDKVEITDRDMKRFYRDNQDRFTIPSRYTARELVVDSVYLDSVLAAFAEGLTFDSAATRYSTVNSKNRGGMLSERPLNVFLPEQQQVITELEIGEMSEPFWSSRGWEILKLETKTENEVIAYEQALSSIEEQMRREQVAELSEAALARFRKSAGVDTVASGDTLARVAGVPIFDADIDEFIQGSGWINPEQAEDTLFRVEILNRMISQMVFAHELAQQKLYINDSLYAMIESRRTQTLVDSYMGEVIEPQAEVSDAEIADYYKVHKKEFWRPAQAKVREMLITDGDTAQMVYALVSEGARFDSLARIYSQAETASRGGYVGYIKKGESDKPYERQAFRLGEGEVSRPINTPDGYWILKVEATQDAYQQTLENSISSIRSQLYREKKTAAEEALRERLMSAAQITIFEPETPEIPDTPGIEYDEQEEPTPQE